MGQEVSADESGREGIKHEVMVTKQSRGCEAQRREYSQ